MADGEARPSPIPLSTQSQREEQLHQSTSESTFLTVSQEARLLELLERSYEVNK